MKTERTPAEIKAKIEEVKGADVFGWVWPMLIEGLPFEDAREYLRADATAEEWDRVRGEHGTPKEAALAYFPFAAEKIVRERGLSATRSVEHLKGWVYLHAGEDAFQQLDDEEYGWYGRRQMQTGARLLGLEKEWLEILAAAEGEQ